MADRIDALFGDLQSRGYAKDKTNQEFRDYMLAPGKQGYENRKQFFEDFKSQGLTDIETYEDFASLMGLHASTHRRRNKPASTPQRTRVPNGFGQFDVVDLARQGMERGAYNSRAIPARRTSNPQASSIGVPFLPDTEMTAAQRDEAIRENDFAVEQVRKIQREEKRRRQPLVDTGNEDVNRNVIKTQGEWEEDLSKGAKGISRSVVIPAVDKAIEAFDKKADEIWGKYNEQSKFTDSASPMSIEISRQSNEAKDPEKILDFLKGQMEAVYKDSAFIDNIGKEADRMGIDRADYLEQVIKPQIESDLASRLTDTLVKRELPKSSAEYIIRGLGDGIVGMLYNAITETKGQRNIKNQADAMTEEGNNSSYTLDTGAKLTRMGISFASDAPFFGLYGRVGGEVVKKVAERQIQKMMAKGLSEGAARNLVGAALENSVGARMKDYLMQHVISSSITLGAYNATSEGVRQVRDDDYDIGRLAGSTVEGLATGAAFGATGAVSQALSQPLSGIAKFGAKAGGFLAEAGTMYTTEELAKMVHGEEGFTNPFEGGIEAIEKLGVMKVSSPGGVLRLGREILQPKKSNQRQRTGVHFNKEEEAYVRNTVEGQSLLDALSKMHPEIATAEAGGKRKLTAEGETLRQQLSDSYNDFMKNPEIPYGVKMKTAMVLGGLVPDAAHTPLEVSSEVVHNEDGSVILKTRDKDGNMMQEFRFDTFSDAEGWREAHEGQFRLNDAVNMFNGSPEAARLKMIDELAEEWGVDREQARTMVDGVLDGANGTSFDNGQFLSVYDAIHRNAYPDDELSVKRNYWEGMVMTPEERHKSVVDAQRAEERLRSLGAVFADEVIAAKDYPDEKMAELAGREEITGEQLLAATDYYNKTAKANGMMEKALTDVDNQVEEANSTIRRNTHTGSGQLIECTKDDRVYYLTAGDIELTPDGRIKGGTGGAVILRDKETGEIKVENPENLMVTSLADSSRLIAENDSMDGLRGQLMQQADDQMSLNSETPEEPQDGDFFLGEDGTRFMVMQADDGQGNMTWLKVNIDGEGKLAGDPVPLDMEEYRNAKSVELDELTFPREEDHAPVTQTGYNVEMAPETHDEVEKGKPQEAEAVDAVTTATPATASSRIPTDERGNPIYEQAKPEDTLEALTEKYGEDTANRMVSQMAANTSNALDALKNTDLSKITDMAEMERHMAALQEAQKKADYWKGLMKEKAVEENRSYSLSDEIDENGRQFVLNKNGEMSFGEISEDTGLPSAPILLSEGMITNPANNDGYGLVHIEAKHGKEIRNAGYPSVIDFIDEVAKNYQTIREGHDRNGNKTYLLQLTDKHNNTLVVELSGDGNYWNVNTAGIFKTSYGAKRNVVYNRHTTAKQPAETAEASLSGEQSGTAPLTSMSAPTQQAIASGGKDNENSPNSQENGGENAIQQPQQATIQPQQAVTRKQAKIYLGTVNQNIGRTFTFTSQGGVRSQMTIKQVDYQGNAVVDRQDYDVEGQPAGVPRQERYSVMKVGEAIVNGVWKKELSTEERLRQSFKGKIAMQNLIDVLTGEEMEKMLRVAESGSQQDLQDLMDELREAHHEDIILNGRNKRNGTVERILSGGGTREEKLRRLRPIYRGDVYPGADIPLSDEALQPVTLEDHVAELLSNIPKMGEGTLAYHSYGEGQDKVVGLADETGFGSRGFEGDTKGFNNWLAPNGKGVSLQRYAENLHEQLPEGIKTQYSDQDVRNAILSVFSSAERPTDISMMAIRRGVEQAEKEARRIEDMWIDRVAYQKKPLDFSERLRKGIETTNTEPTEGQKKAGNYKKGHVSFGGYDFTIENPRGSMRRGTDESGKQWEQQMQNTYGYILGRYGRDGNHLDMFLNDEADLDNWSGKVYVVDQVNPESGDFDEHKVMYGFASEEEARQAYLSNYEEGWQGLGSITGVSKLTFDKWLDSSKRKQKEFSEHSIVKKALEKSVQGLDGYTRQEILDMVRSDIESVLTESGVDGIEIKGMDIHGSRGRGTAKEDSDLDVVVEYKGDISEDGLFNILNDEPITIDGIKVDINPITEGKSGSIDQYMRRSREYDRQMLESQTKERDRQMMEALGDHMKSVGIAVSTDWEEGQRVLDAFNGKLNDGIKQMGSRVDSKNGIRFFKTSDGEAYGYTYQGKIYIDPRIATSETPIHEYTHLWAEMKRRTSPKEWDVIKNTLLGDKTVQPFINEVRDLYPELSEKGREDDFVEEVLTQFSGRHGAERMREVAQKIQTENNGMFGKAQAVEALRRIRSLLDKFWHGVANMMGWKYTSAEDIADKVLHDLLSDVNPSKDIIEGQERRDGDKTLMGVHNISEEKLRKAIRQGGLANPSLAVIDTQNGMHTDYGEISLIPKSSLIDSKTGRNAGTFAGDAWTAVYPQVERQMSDKGRDAYYKDLQGITDDRQLTGELKMVWDNYLEGRDPDNLAYWFLKDKGIEPERVLFDSGYTEDQRKRYAQLTDNGRKRFTDMSDEERDGIIALMAERDGVSVEEKLDKYQTLRKRNAEMLDDEDIKPIKKALLQNNIEEIDKYGIPLHSVNDFLYGMKRAFESDGKLDARGTLQAARDKMLADGLEEDFKRWLDEKEQNYGVREMLFDGFTHDGDRKYVPNTLENASRIMNRQPDANAGDQAGFGASRAILLRKMDSLAEIRKQKGKLKGIDEDIERRYQEASEEMFQIVSALSDMQEISDNQFSNVDYANSRLNDALTKKDPIGYLNKEYGYDIDKNGEFAKGLSSILQTLENLPVKYFETKFKRPVGLDEFTVAVVPEGTSEDIVKALSDNGLTVRTYDNSGNQDAREASRRKAVMDAVQDRDDIMFQKKFDDIKPVGKGDFGDIYDQFKGKPKEAIDFLMRKRGGEVLGSLSHKDVGEIDLVWGEEGTGKSDGFGLAKLAKHHPEVLENLQEILDDMHVTKRTDNRINLESDTHQAAVRLTWNEQKKNWLLTAFEKKNSALDNTTDTGKTSDRGKWNDTATPLSTVSESKGTENSINDQENREKISYHKQSQLDIISSSDSAPEPEMTPENKQYWRKWDSDMRKWKERHGLAADAQMPTERPKLRQGEMALDYAKRLLQARREEALWRTAPKIEDYRQRRDDDTILEEARQQERKYPESVAARMQRAAAELQKVRHAVSRQKAYDKATVKAVTDFAQDFMRMGFGDNLSRGEMERMLSSVKNATGARNIKKEVDNILNILIDNQLRNLDQEVTRLSSVRELRQTAQGVETQGKLELKGQRMIQAFRDARSERLTIEEIRERMAEISERMDANDDEAPMREQEYEGLSIALQYAENVDESRKEWADLDRRYKDAVKGYKENGRSYQAQQELLESIDQAMMENKMERIGMFGDIIGRLEGNIVESIKGAKEFREREKQRIERIRQMANFDLAGKEMGAMRVDKNGKAVRKGKAANFFLQPLATFEQILNQFGERNANGEGYLYNYFMRNWMDATNNAYLGEMRAKGELDQQAREVFGSGVRRWSDLYKVSNKYAADVEVIDQGEKKTLRLTQGNLLYIYMAEKMADGRMKLRNMGITEADVERLADVIDPRLLQLADWIQEDYLMRKRTEYNKIHERMFGASMAAIDNYFPIRVLGDARVQEQDVAGMANPDDVLPSIITGSIIRRRRNTLPLDILHTDAVSLALEHVEAMEKWAATAEWNKDVNTLLSYTTFRNKVKNMKTVYGSGDALWDTLCDTARMAAGTYRPKVKPGSADEAISNVAKGVTAAKINFRIFTAAKQLLSLPAFLHDVRMDDFAKNLANPYGSWQWAMENMPVFRKRWESRQVGDTRLMDDPTDWRIWKNNVVQLATMMGMSPNALIDGITCAVGARSIYETKMRKYKKIGATDEIAHKRALQDAMIGYNLTQQSSEGAFVSAIQKERTVAANMLSVFRNSSMSYTRQWWAASRNLRHRMQAGYKEDSTRFMAGQLQEELSLTAEQARQAAEAVYARAGRRDFARLLNMMFGVTVAWNLGGSFLYLWLGDDSHAKDEMMTDALLKGLVAGPVEGFAAGNIISEIAGRMLSEETRKTVKREGWGEGFDAALKQGGDYEVNPLPLLADIQSMIGKLGYDKYAAAQDVFNICVQSAVGVHPQTFTDMWNAVMDYAAPGWDGTKYTYNKENMGKAKELSLFIMRLINAPVSSWRNEYIDELGMNVKDARKLSYDEMAARYAHYKHWKDAPMAGWLRDDEARGKKMDKILSRFDAAVMERMDRLDDLELLDNWNRSGSVEEKRMMGKVLARRAMSSDKEGESAKTPWQREYQYYRTYQDAKEGIMLHKRKQEVKGRGDLDALAAIKRKESAITDKKKELLRDGVDIETVMGRIRQLRREALEIAMRSEEAGKRKP